MFDHGPVSVTPAPAALEQLRERMRLMERPTTRVDLTVHPSVQGVVQLRSGGSYEVADLGLALALLAGPTGAGEWCAVVGVPDFGAEAAVGLGVALERTVLVPDPGDQWLEVAAALADVVTVVLLRPGARVTESVAAKLAARLRQRGAALVVHAQPGTWPRCEARLGAPSIAWRGLGAGHGRLRSREVTVQVRQGAAPARTVTVQLPADPDPRLPGPAPTLVPVPRLDPVWQAG